MKKKELSINTRAILEDKSMMSPANGSIPDIVMATTFALKDEVSFSFENQSEQDPFTYTRWSNPTIRLLEKKLAGLENGEDGVALGSGMGAFTSIALSFLKTGDRIIVSDICYAGVREFCNNQLPGLGIEVDPVNMSELQDVASALSKPAKLVFIETPCNPILRLTNIREVCKLAKSAGALSIVDSTFASPIATRPIDMGADFVIHSMTKYLCGHGDAMGGIVIGRKKHIDLIRSSAVIHGGCTLSPFNAWLINRGLATLLIRMKAHSDHALKLAQLLENNSKVKRVNYPGLKSHPQHELAKDQMDLYSGVLSFQLKNNTKAVVKKMLKTLEVVHYAVSLGHHKSLVFFISTDDIQKSSFRLTKKNLESYKDYAGDGVFRLSVGLEDPEDIYNDLTKTFV